MGGLILFQLWRNRPGRRDVAWVGGFALFSLAVVGAMWLTLYADNVLKARAWPSRDIGDQILLGSSGDLYAKLPAWYLIQRYDCEGRFVGSFIPDAAGGIYKIALEDDGVLGIYSVRKDAVDRFSATGEYLGRQSLNSNKMPFEFQKDGPSSFENGGCRFEMDANGVPSIRNLQSGRLSRLEAGDWLLENLLAPRYIVLLALVGFVLMFSGYMIQNSRRSRRN